MGRTEIINFIDNKAKDLIDGLEDIRLLENIVHKHNFYDPRAAELFVALLESKVESLKYCSGDDELRDLVHIARVKRSILEDE